jgi:hypothetical protein
MAISAAELGKLVDTVLAAAKKAEGGDTAEQVMLQKPRKAPQKPSHLWTCRHRCQACVVVLSPHTPAAFYLYPCPEPTNCREELWMD